MASNTLTLYITEILNSPPQDQEQDKDFYSQHIYSTLYEGPNQCKEPQLINTNQKNWGKKKTIYSQII